VDLALSLFDAENIAPRFLAAFSPLCELGFERDDVKDALVLKNLDKDLALEFLINKK
jgi:hypothetical protein